MFQFTNQYAATTLGQAGGVALYISEFLSQFYVVIGIGPVIAALTLTGIAFFSFLFLKKISLRDDLPFVRPASLAFLIYYAIGLRLSRTRNDRLSFFIILLMVVHESEAQDSVDIRNLLNPCIILGWRTCCSFICSFCFVV